jgi:hypothetical protein
MTSIRTFLRVSILLLTIVVIIELTAVASIPLLVPDIGTRLQRIGATPQHPAPPDNAAPSATAWSRPLEFSDTFERVSPRWDQSNSVISNQGTLSLSLGLANTDVYTLFVGPPAGSVGPIQDFDIGLDIQQSAGADDASYGVRFRQHGSDSYLFVALNHRGYWRVVRSTFGEIVPITPWQFSRHITPGIGVNNHLRVVATADTVALYINGIDHGTIRDDAPSAGQLTIGMATGSAGAATIDIDNVVVTANGFNLTTSFADDEPPLFSLGGAYSDAGQYQLVASAGISIWQTPLPRSGSEIADFQLSLDGRIVAGNPESLAYGVVFGDSGDFAYTMVLMSGNGTLQVVRSDPVNGDVIYVAPTQVDIINTGIGDTNTIELILINGLLTIGINDVELGSVDVGTSPQGSVGMMLVCGDSDAQVAFDNFSLRELGP